MNQRKRAVLIFILALFCIPAACGKKGPPSLPNKDLPFKVSQLSADREGDSIQLIGKIVNVDSPKTAESDIAGCRIYRARYAVENPPCEGCPMDYKLFLEIREQVVAKARFSCRIDGGQPPGIYFFKVRLVGANGEIGPYSDAARLTVEPRR